MDNYPDETLDPQPADLPLPLAAELLRDLALAIPDDEPCSHEGFCRAGERRCCKTEVKR